MLMADCMAVSVVSCAKIRSNRVLTVESSSCWLGPESDFWVVLGKMLSDSWRT